MASKMLAPRWYFNPRPPRGGRQALEALIDQETGISIHAPREGGDPQQPTQTFTEIISIHAPREGGDSKDAQFYL